MDRKNRLQSSNRRALESTAGPLSYHPPGLVVKEVLLVLFQIQMRNDLGSEGRWFPVPPYRGGRGTGHNYHRMGTGGNPCRNWMEPLGTGAGTGPCGKRREPVREPTGGDHV